MRLVIVALLAAGCQPEPKDFPPLGGGGGGGVGGGSTGGGDGGIDTDATGTLIDGRVCIVRDLRLLDACDDTGAEGVIVRIGNKEAEALDDGSFSIETPSGTGLVWRITDPALVTTLSQFGPTLIIPAIRVTTYNNLLNDNGIVLTPGQGSVVTQILDDDGAVTNATAATTPQAQFATRYDGTSAVVWDQDATSTRGVAWIAGVAAASGAASLIVAPPVGQSSTSIVPVEDGAITFATIEL